MSKIPVFDTVGETYSFSFRHYLKLFAVTWLPMLIATAVSIYMMKTYIPESMAILKQQISSPGTPAVHPMAGWIGLIELVMMLLLVMMSVGITKEVLGVREGPRFVYFRFGADELRLLAGFVIVVLILFVALVLASVVAAVVGIAAMHGAAQQNPSAMAGLVGPIMLVLYLIALYFVVRFSFFLPAVVVAEKRIGLGRAWELSKGNFWRIFAIGLLIWIPIIVVEVVLLGVILGPSISDGLANLPRGIQSFMLALQEAEFAKMPQMLALNFVLSPILYGLMLAPSAFAYRAVNPGEANAA